MNRHFEDTVYYLKRAVQTAKKGVMREFEPVEKRVRSLTGREKEPEPSRFEAIKSDLKDREVGKALGKARETVGERRGRTVETR